ncbi:MAG: molybdopterin-dependent oxidoreductase [Candidatus Micrarchaeota archaeon]
MRWLLFSLLFSAILVSGCFGPAGPIALDGTEIEKYEGEDLSAISDFRENSIKGPQYVDEGTYRLTVSGLVDEPREYTVSEVLGTNQRYSKAVTLDCVEGWSVKILWEGVLVRDLIDKSGPKPEAKTVIFKAYDGYSTSFPIEYFDDNDIIMAYKMNNVTIPPERGYPFMLVAESKWGYKWIKWITGIELSNDTSYEGYWESRGYSESGNLNESFFD